jgi:hypothetical protein
MACASGPMLRIPSVSLHEHICKLHPSELRAERLRMGTAIYTQTRFWSPGMNEMA